MRKRRQPSPITKPAMRWWRNSGLTPTASARYRSFPRSVAALGYTQQTPTEDRYLLRRSELLDRLNVSARRARGRGDRVSQQRLHRRANDLQRATEMARQMVAQFGYERDAWVGGFRAAGARPVSGRVDAPGIGRRTIANAPRRPSTKRSASCLRSRTCASSARWSSRSGAH